MLHHETKVAQVAETFVQATIDSAPHASTFFYNLEKLPREEISRHEALFLPLFEHSPNFESFHQGRFHSGELILKACYTFGLCWSLDMLENVVVPYLRDYFNEVEFLPPICQSALDNQRQAAIEVLAHLSPALTTEVAEPLFEQLFDLIVFQEKVSVASLLALAQFGQVMTSYDRQFGEATSDVGHPACVVAAAIVQTIETLKESMSEHMGFSPRQYAQESRLAREALRALNVLGSIADDIIDLPGMRKDLEQIVSDGQWLISVLDLRVNRVAMEFNSVEESRKTTGALRVAFACLAQAHPDLKNLVRDYPVELNLDSDVFGSLLLKGVLSGFTADEEMKVLAITEDTLDAIAPGSRCGPGREQAERVAAAVWRLGLGSDDIVLGAFRGRCDPPTQSFLYRRLLS